ncbi:hypothetical protein AAG906_028663 [Vitis piasezkii]
MNQANSRREMATVVHIPLLILLLHTCFGSTSVEALAGHLPDEEKGVLKEIAEQLGKKDWKFELNPCDGNSNWNTLGSRSNPFYNNTITCNCFPNGECHVDSISLKGQDLAGVLPPALAKLSYLKTIHLTRNYLSGNIPPEWETTKGLDGNQFSGTVPPELGKLVDLQKLILNSNNLTGPLPQALAHLTNLKELRISSNNFTGKIPSFIQSWKQLEQLEIQASGLEGPIPSNISVLSNLIELRISDLNGEGSTFPPLRSMKRMYKLMLRGQNISGPIPIYSKDDELRFYLSFNKLNGEIPNLDDLTNMEVINGNIPDGIKGRRAARIEIDLSYNNFSEQSHHPLEFVRSFSEGNLELGGCLKNYPCQKVNRYSLHINCGGEKSTVGNVVYEGINMKELELEDFNIVQAAQGVDKVVKILIAVLVSIGFVFTILGLICWKCYFGQRTSREQELRGLDLQTGLFTLRQIKAATNNFDAANKIGEGGFGSVYKGTLLDGTIIAVKQLSSKSKQGNREFVNEIGMISALQHPHLVRLYGCCVEGNQLILVYEYMENNSLARALFGKVEYRLNLDWSTRQRICVGIARGLAFLHEGSTLKIVHRDIKANNILLDTNLNPKISDFGLAKLDEEDNTHISTRVAGTIGYMAPEYALWGYLTYKADVYSFGVVALELVAGKNNMKYRPNEDYFCLLDWAFVLQQKGNLMELVDPNLGTEFKRKRPTMSAVVSMLKGQTVVQEYPLNPSIYGDEFGFEALRGQHDQTQLQSSSEIEPSIIHHVQHGWIFLYIFPRSIKCLYLALY